MSTSSLQQSFDDAVEHHRAGRLQEARSVYERILHQQPGHNPARHNLGMVLVGQGLLAPGEALVQQAWEAAPDEPAMQQTARKLGELFYRQGYWQEARKWLLRVQNDSEADKVASLLRRLRLPEYLAPEVYDPRAGEVLQRYAPREAADYVYAIDIVGTCNLRCPTCPVGNTPRGKRPKGFMSLELLSPILQKIQSECPCPTPQIWFYNWGEPLLHPELPAFVRAVKQAGLRVHLSTNLNIEQGLKALIKSEPDELKVSISGFDPDTYATTHVRGDIQLVKSNLYLLRRYIDRYRAGTRVWVNAHQYRNNVEQQGQLVALCRELGFELFPIQAFFQPLERLYDLVTGSASPEDYPILDQLLVSPLDYVPNIKARRRGDFDCELRFNQTVINFDGSVALCCGVYEAENMLGVQFLDKHHSALETMKYEHPFCQRCRAQGLDYSPTTLPDNIHPAARSSSS